MADWSSAVPNDVCGLGVMKNLPNKIFIIFGKALVLSNLRVHTFIIFNILKSTAVFLVKLAVIQPVFVNLSCRQMGNGEIRNMHLCDHIQYRFIASSGRTQTWNIITFVVYCTANTGREKQHRVPVRWALVQIVC